MGGKRKNEYIEYPKLAEMIFVKIQREGDVGVMRESIPQPSANARDAQSAQHYDKIGPKTGQQRGNSPKIQVRRSQTPQIV